MELARQLESIEPRVSASPWPDHEYGRGYGVMAMPTSKGHVLALRVFPENDFAPYVTVWHRAPEHDCWNWSIFVDGPRFDTACPRYYGPATRQVQHAQITLEWTSPIKLRVEMDAPCLEWTMSLAETPLLKAMNAVSAPLPLWTWKPGGLLRARELMAKQLLDMGDIRLSGVMPSGHFGVLMPQRIYFITASRAELDGRDLGEPARAAQNPKIGEFPLPARPTLAVGQYHMRVKDQEEYRRTLEELRNEEVASPPSSWTQSRVP